MLTDEEVRNRFIAELLRSLERRGLRIVPVEPTEAMVEAGKAEWCRHNHGEPYDKEIPAIYRAMLSANQKENEK